MIFLFTTKGPQKCSICPSPPTFSTKALDSFFHLTPCLILCPSVRLESQMTADIQAILQLLQRQTAAGPPAYSTVTSSPEYQRPAIRVQPVSAVQTELSLAPAPPRPQVHFTLLQQQARKEGRSWLYTENVPPFLNNMCYNCFGSVSEQKHLY